MVATWAAWMFGSAVHYTFLPRCLSRSMMSVVDFAILQAALTGVVSWAMRRGRHKPKQSQVPQHQLAPVAEAAGGTAQDPPVSAVSPAPDGRSNILIAGAAFAVAITMTNASVAYGSVSGSRMVKSLEPAIVAALQLVAGMDSRADFPWVFLLALAVCMMLAVAPTGITLISAVAALLSTAGISTRNVYVKKHMLAAKAASAGLLPSMGTPSSLAIQDKPGVGSVAGTQGSVAAAKHRPPSSTTDVQTYLNFVACAILMVFASGWVVLRGWGSSDVAMRTRVRLSDLVIASVSFAAFQVAALLVLEHVTPTRQAAIKSLQNALTTAWALLIDSNGKRHSALEIMPALVWGICVVALATDAQMSISLAPLTAWRPYCLPLFGTLGGRHSRGKLGDEEAIGGIIGGSARQLSVRTPGRMAWFLVYWTCLAALFVQCGVMAARTLPIAWGPAPYAIESIELAARH